jgi:hypothetical protein
MNSEEFVSRELDTLENCKRNIDSLKTKLPDVGAFREIIGQYRTMIARAEFVKYEDINPQIYKNKKIKERDSFVESCRSMSADLLQVIEEMEAKRNRLGATTQVNVDVPADMPPAILVEDLSLQDSSETESVATEDSKDY